MMHFGINNAAQCGLSTLLIKSTTTDLQSVDCVKCLWSLLADSMRATDILANRLKVVTDERSALLSSENKVVMT